MTHRDQQLLALRPAVPAAVLTDTMSSKERFQNETLRPILKLQNPAIVALFQHYIVRRKNEFYQLSETQRPDYVQRAVQRDALLRNTLRGMVLGHFTDAEWKQYRVMIRPLDKRILQLATQRLQDQFSSFDETSLPK